MKPEKDRKTVLVAFRVTPEERRSLKRNAKAMRQTVSKYIRTLHGIASGKADDAK